MRRRAASPPTMATTTSPPMMAGALLLFFSDCGAATADRVGLVLNGGEAEDAAANGGTLAVNALTTFKTPYPHLSSRPGGPLSVAVAVSRWITSCAERFGNFDRINAAAPDTMAVAAEEPFPLTYPFLGNAPS